MKKMILTALSVVTFGSAASFAQVQPEVIEPQEAIVFEQEDGAIDAQTWNQLANEGVVEYRSDAGQIIGGIIGGIIGAIGADRWDKDNNRPNRFVTCFAQDRRGNTYRATARRARAAQNLALQKCQNNARQCRPAGCR